MDGPHDVARFSNPVNVEVASDGRVYVADFDNDAIRVISTTGVVSTLVRPADVLPLTFSRPFGLTIAPDGFLYVQTDGNDVGARDATTGTVWRVDLGTGMATVVARNLGRPRGLQALANGMIAMSDLAHHVVTILNPATGVETLLAGANDTPGFVNAAGPAARFSRPYGLALLPDGSLLVADQDNDRLRQVTLAGVVTTFAGTGVAGTQNGPVATASFNAPQDVAIAGADTYVADHDNFLIRRINAGNVTTQAGNGMQDFADGEGSAASFFGMEGIALNASGSILWIADGNNGNGDPFNRVRRLNVP
ncbi:MAG: hypothetical protein ACRETN_03350 [Nevskiales bacterium]